MRLRLIRMAMIRPCCMDIICDEILPISGSLVAVKEYTLDANAAPFDAPPLRSGYSGR